MGELFWSMAEDVSQKQYCAIQSNETDLELATYCMGIVRLNTSNSGD